MTVFKEKTSLNQKLVKQSLILICLYQRVTSHKPSTCRYIPTCSSYALEALEKHGLLPGIWLTLRRLCRCHPWSKQNGWDPVPSAAVFK